MGRVHVLRRRRRRGRHRPKTRAGAEGVARVEFRAFGGEGLGFRVWGLGLRASGLGLSA